VDSLEERLDLNLCTSSAVFAFPARSPPNGSPICTQD
jgi:hypothetical protein